MVRIKINNKSEDQTSLFYFERKIGHKNAYNCRYINALQHFKKSIFYDIKLFKFLLKIPPNFERKCKRYHLSKAL